MKELLKGFLLHIQFLTRIPLPVKIPYNGKLLARTFFLAPLVGLIPGLAMAGCYYLSAFCGERLVSVMSVLVAGVLLTGGLHLDGFADTCDGLGSGRDRDKILEIMKDSRIGVMGALGLILLLLSRGVLLYATGEKYIYGCLVCIPVAGRINAVWLAGLSAYAGSTRGMGAVYAEECGIRDIVLACIAGAIPCFLVSGYAFIVPLAITVCYTIYFSRLLKKRIGGMTGDTLGYIIEVSEVLFLLFFFLQQIILTKVQLPNSY